VKQHTVNEGKQAHSLTLEVGISTTKAMLQTIIGIIFMPILYLS